MFKLLVLFCVACNSDFASTRDDLIESWWALDGDDLNFNVYLEVDPHYLNEGQLWYQEYSPYYDLSSNEDGGYWKLPSSHELELTLSDSLKKWIVDEDITPIAPNTLAFSLDLRKDDCYNVVLKLPIDQSGIACPYQGDFL